MSTEEKAVNEEQSAPDGGASVKPDKAYLITYNGDYQDVTVEAFDTKDLALIASNTSPKEKALIIQEPSDLVQYDLKQLLDIYNGVNGTQLSRFRTLESGRERILTSVKGLANAEARASASTDASTASEGDETVARSKAKKKPAKAPTERKKRKGNIDGDKKIQHTDKFKEFEPREGTARAKSYALMKSGSKVSTYVENGGIMFDLRDAIKLKRITLV